METTETHEKMTIQAYQAQPGDMILEGNTMSQPIRSAHAEKHSHGNRIVLIVPRQRDEAQIFEQGDILDILRPV